MQVPNKLVIFTPFALLPESKINGLRPDTNAEKFAEILSLKAQNELKIPNVSTKLTADAAATEAITSLQIFLQKSDAAVIVVSGNCAAVLDLIYPQLLVYLTMEPQFQEKITIVFLGEPSGCTLFDKSVLNNHPVLFGKSPARNWEDEKESWRLLYYFVKKTCAPVKVPKPPLPDIEASPQPEPEEHTLGNTALWCGAVLALGVAGVYLFNSHKV